MESSSLFNLKRNDGVGRSRIIELSRNVADLLVVLKVVNLFREGDIS